MSVCVCLSVCQLVTTISCAKTAQDDVRLWDRMGLRNRVLDGARIFPGEGAILRGHVPASCVVYGIYSVRLIFSALFDRQQQQCGYLLSVLQQLLCLWKQMTDHLIFSGDFACSEQGHVRSKSLLHQNSPVLSGQCWLTRIYLQNVCCCSNDLKTLSHYV